ncbi:unnamed protein product [Darwinula stevensoni]|uniref:G-protein coupled receptors family 1 profile domain-containing protein n=1 Tax=Darwinula stevensoni TaxID=69355 RepID=A0A7R8X773_9CRUS|nr:unnamed protein product [Darwinula stevensoni]CAG0887634.1 unnamed protein product [Darwinula stevensoni]
MMEDGGEDWEWECNGTSETEEAKINGGLEEERIENLKYYAYGVAMPIVCCLGILGNSLNLLVLTRPNMKAASYNYMRAYTGSALAALFFVVFFCVRILEHREVGPWKSLAVAFFHVYLELYFGNALLANGVMMVMALTVERFTAICHPEKHVGADRKKSLMIVFASPILCFVSHAPFLLNSRIVTCPTADPGRPLFFRRDNETFHVSLVYQIYLWILQAVFRIAPVIILVYLNLRIAIAYRRVCRRRRGFRLRGRGASGTDQLSFADQRRLLLLLGGTSTLFFVCVSPMAVMSVMFSEIRMNQFPFEVFRAVANVLEITNFSLTFYIYCLLSRDFRETFFRTVGLKSWLSTVPSRPSACVREAPETDDGL